VRQALTLGLPALTSANFSVIEYLVPPPCELSSIEESLDVEWAHAIAPGANIVVLVTPNVPDSGFPQDINLAVVYAVAMTCCLACALKTLVMPSKARALVVGISLRSKFS
jgi:subtilase family serine protease